MSLFGIFKIYSHIDVGTGCFSVNMENNSFSWLKLLDEHYIKAF
jgi:hypothetical protein